MWIDKGHFSLLALPLWRRTPASFSVLSSKWLMPEPIPFFKRKPFWYLLCCLSDGDCIECGWSGSSASWKEHSRSSWQLGKKMLVVRNTGLWPVLSSRKVSANWNAGFPLPYPQSCRYSFISLEALLWSLYIPWGCHSDLITNPGHILRALIKQFAFSPSSLPSHWKITEFEHEVKGLRLSPESPDTAPAACHFVEWWLICQYFFLFSQVPGLLDLVRLAPLEEE